jgi:hypothetical protein
MKITPIEPGLWDIGGRGKIERTPQGKFFVGTDEPNGKWSDEEIAQINKFIDDTKAEG